MIPQIPAAIHALQGIKNTIRNTGRVVELNPESSSKVIRKDF